MLISAVVMALTHYLRKIARRSPGEVLREGFRRARVAFPLERRLGRGRAFAPYAVSFWLTRRCNLNCEMCWVERSRRLEGDDYVRGRRELTLAELKGVIDDVVRWRPRVGITGGEPFVRGDTLAFIAYVKSSGLRCGANTNGTFLGRDAEALVESGLDGIMVSVDGPPAVHDRIRRSPGSFVKTKEGLEALLAARERQGGRTPYVKITCTITNANAASLAGLPTLFLDLPLDEFTFQHLWFTEQDTADAQRALFAKLFAEDTTYLQGFVTPDVPPVDVEELRRQARAIKNKRWPFPVNFYPDLDDGQLGTFYERPRQNFRERCFSRWLRVDVLPDGAVTPCLGLEVGNVRDKPFWEIWNGPALRRFRRELAARGVFPGCGRCCGLFSD
ncbi:MAG: radical SAM protein [candidate division Zixibacteria bacterium]|nr:radical SAM protein [candidate division Zixibacteria bacterium]